MKTIFQILWTKKFASSKPHKIIHTNYMVSNKKGMDSDSTTFEFIMSSHGYFCPFHFIKLHLHIVQNNFMLFKLQTNMNDSVRGGKLNELMSLTEFSLSHSYQSNCQKQGHHWISPHYYFQHMPSIHFAHAQLRGFPHYYVCTCSVPQHKCIISRGKYLPICDGKYHWYDSK